MTTSLYGRLTAERRNLRILSIFLAGLSMVSIHPLHVSGSLIELGAMLECATGRSPFDFNCYGCYCGIGGSGTPIDDIDMCCYYHDQCYNRASHLNCTSYTDSYAWDCLQRSDDETQYSASCSVDNLTDDNESNNERQPRHPCAAVSCRCDSQLANCLRNMGATELNDNDQEKPSPPLPNCPDRKCLFNLGLK